MPPGNVLWVAIWIGSSGTLAAGAAVERFKCRDDEFLCNNKERCINQFDKCDGIKNCPDGSDESHANCWSFGKSCGVTQPSAFKCAYGACIDGFKECDGKPYDCADNSDETHCSKRSETPETTARCQSTEFTCQNGDCISLNDVCDGMKNCADGSDETVAECTLMKCQLFSFPCTYGACIDGDKMCDGNKDCVDGSDEAQDLCNKQVDAPDDTTINKAGDANSTANTCPFPSDPHTIYSFPGKKHPPAPVKVGSAVVISCPPGYGVPKEFEGNRAYMACSKPPDFTRTITCEKLCHPLVSKYHNLECRYNQTVVPCDRPINPGTIAHVSCKEYFKPENDFKAVTQTTCLQDGTWVDELYSCIPECGISKFTHQTKVAYGSEVSPGDAPWYAGFWGKKNNTYEHFCGGTIISSNMIITAAHCLSEYRARNFYDTSYADKLDEIRVAVRKFDSDWNVKGEHVQIARVKKFDEVRGYIGPPDFEKDLAVVTLFEDLEFSDYVLPACVEWEPEGPVRGRPQGYIVGFGNNEYGKRSEKLAAASLYYISRKDCSPLILKSSGGSKKNVMWDQFCAGAGYTPGNPNVQSVQQGDSGGGYTFRRNNKYYLIGVLSYRRLSGNDNPFAVYTSIPEHIDYLRKLCKPI